MSCDIKHADASTQLDVDESILDYLCYSATKDLLRAAHNLGAPSCDAREFSRADKLLQLVGSFLPIFNTLHSSSPNEPELRFRLRLLRFTALFTRRKHLPNVSHVPSKLQELRANRRDYANAFRSSCTNRVKFVAPLLARFPLPLNPIKAVEYEISCKGSSAPRSKDESQDQLPSVSLLDTLPSFIALSAAQVASQEESSITEMWMRLAADYMAQAVAEQYLVYKSQRPDILQEAFAWGFDESSLAAEGTDEFAINVMFFDEDAEGTNSAWEDIRDDRMRALIPPEGFSLDDHLQMLLEQQLTMAAFEQCIIAFLEGLHNSQAMPILVQVESGNIEGISAREVCAISGSLGFHSD